MTNEENWMVQQDENGQWWCVRGDEWGRSPMTVILVTLVPEKRRCTVDLGKIAILDLAGYEVDVPGIGSWYIRVSDPYPARIYDCNPGSEVVLTIEE